CRRTDCGRTSPDRGQTEDSRRPFSLSAQYVRQIPSAGHIEGTCFTRTLTLGNGGSLVLERDRDTAPKGAAQGLRGDEWMVILRSWPHRHDGHRPSSCCWTLGSSLRV